MSLIFTQAVSASVNQYNGYALTIQKNSSLANHSLKVVEYNIF